MLDYIKQADVVLGLGTRFSQITTQDYTLLTDTANLIHVDVSPDVIGKVHTPSIAIAADVNEFLKHLLPIIEANNNPTREQLVSTLHEKYIVYSTPKQDYQDDYVDLDGMIFDFIQNIPKDSIIATDAGNFYSWLSRYYRFEQAGTFLGPTSGAMGYGLPSAIGAKLAHPNQPVISFSGDGGFMMTMQEFETAVRYNIPVISIVVNNNMYGTIRMHQEKHFPNPVVGTELTNPSFAKMAQLFGGHGEKVEKNTDFIPVLQRALSAKRPALIEVMTNPLILSASQAKPMKEANHSN